MKNSEIAHYLAEKVFRPAITDEDFAVQLFIEHVVRLPDTYDQDDLKMAILYELTNRDDEKEN